MRVMFEEGGKYSQSTQLV